MSIPITVFTGFVGAGKTTTILGLLSSLPQGYRACLLKNEYGDVQVDSQLAKASSLAAVDEILNGCMCCILVGQMKTALLEIRDKYSPDRIFIETSGSAFPATLAFQIRELERETGGDFKLDAIVTVIDAENFTGYEDTSPTAKMQASYTDVILINKWESVSERQLDIVLDHLHTLNELTPKIKCNGRGGVDSSLIFGLDSKLFAGGASEATKGRSGDQDQSHNEEIQAITIRSGERPESHQASACHNSECNCHHTHSSSLDAASAGQDWGGSQSLRSLLTTDQLASVLSSMPKGEVWRIKGFIRLLSPDAGNGLRSDESNTFIINWAFGRFELTPYTPAERENVANILLTMMGERGEIVRHARRLAEMLGATIS